MFSLVAVLNFKKESPRLKNFEKGKFSSVVNEENPTSVSVVLVLQQTPRISTICILHQQSYLHL